MVIRRDGCCSEKDFLLLQGNKPRLGAKRLSFMAGTIYFVSLVHVRSILKPMRLWLAPLIYKIFNVWNSSQLEIFPVSFMAGTLFTCFCIYGWHHCDMSSILASGSAVCCFDFLTLTGRNSFAGN